MSLSTANEPLPNADEGEANETRPDDVAKEGDQHQQKSTTIPFSSWTDKLGNGLACLGGRALDLLILAFVLLWEGLNLVKWVATWRIFRAWLDVLLQLGFVLLLCVMFVNVSLLSALAGGLRGRSPRNARRREAMGRLQANSFDFLHRAISCVSFWMRHPETNPGGRTPAEGKEVCGGEGEGEGERAGGVPGGEEGVVQMLEDRLRRRQADERLPMQDRDDQDDHDDQDDDGGGGRDAGSSSLGDGSEDVSGSTDATEGELVGGKGGPRNVEARSGERPPTPADPRGRSNAASFRGSSGNFEGEQPTSASPDTKGGNDTSERSASILSQPAGLQSP